MPPSEPDIAALVDRARAANPTLSADTAAISAAKSRSSLADKAWYPDLTIGGGPLIQTNNRPVASRRPSASTSRSPGDVKRPGSTRLRRGWVRRNRNTRRLSRKSRRAG
ncbi:MAG: hypothetical protein WDN69_10255 [Aliidongia sp.]